MLQESYVYVVFRPNGIPCYVGKGKGDRWRRHDRKSKQNPHFAAILNLAGGDLPTAIIRHNLTDDEAIEIEIALIKAIGREIHGGPLVNMTDGGDGTAGAVMTLEWRAHRSKKAKEAWANEEVRAKMLRADRKRSGNKLPRTNEFKKAVGLKLKGNTHTLGFKHTDNSKAKMKSRWRDPIWKANEMARRKSIGMYSLEACARRWAVRRKAASFATSVD